MKLLKVNLVLIPLVALCLGAVGYAARKIVLENERQHVLQNARMMLATALSSRNYTVKQITPLIQQYDYDLQNALSELRKGIQEVPKVPSPDAANNIPGGLKKGFLLGQQRALDDEQQYLESLRRKVEEFRPTEYHPQSVSFFAAIQILAYLHEKFPDYSYKEATLNPTNPRDRASDWESYVINQFRSGAAQNEFSSTLETPSGASLFLAQPIRVNNVGCLECHSTPDKAPPEMVRLYGPNNGFGWNMDEIIGAQIVSMPEALPMQMAEGSFRALVAWLAGAFVAIVLIANAVIAFGTRVQS